MNDKRSRKILVAMIDGFGPEYLAASDMPNLKRMISRGTRPSTPSSRRAIRPRESRS